MELDDVMKELIQRLEDLKLLTTDTQLHKADEIWDRLLVLIQELYNQNRRSTDVLQRLQNIGLQDITAKYLEYNRPSLQIKVMEFTTVFASMMYSYDRLKPSQRLNNQIVQLMQSPNRQVKLMAINACTEVYSYRHWSQEDQFDIKPMVEIIVHESDQQVLRLAIDLFSKVCHSIDDQNFGIVLSRLVSRLESSSGSVAVGFIKNLQIIFWNIYPHDRVKAVKCGIIPALVNTLRYSDNFELKPRMIWIAGTAASKMRNFPVSLVRSLIFEQLTISACDVDMNGFFRLFDHVNSMIQKSTNKTEMIKVFQEYGIVQQLNTIISRTDIDLYDYDTGIVNLLKTLVDFADNHPDSSIRTELDQGEMFENLTAIVQSDTADHRNKRAAGQIIETCFQYRVHVASSDIWPYNDNAEIDMKSGMAGYKHGQARTLVEMRTIHPMFKYIDIHNGTKGYKPPSQPDRGGMESDTQVIRPVYVPTLPEHFEPNYELGKPVSLHGRNLQVIVKLTNIQLTPSKPKYDEGNWHNEGPINESIVATGLYYYDVENITTPKLDFRVAVDRFDYQGASDMYWKDVYDIDQESPRNQYIGSLELPNGRCVVYPNRYQHKEQSFELADPTQPGHCKILTFFVVNPSRRIVSTAHVAPQQPQWCNSSLDKTPILPELWNDATQYIQGVQSPTEAKHYRDELTSDRTRIIKAYNKYRYMSRRIVIGD
ncbi:hypothetical protein BDEG_20007 [Batrachochytrium dendrobatidis JEL423]|uniref:DUF4246 domain-containing protein n=1 Tax=Batrachochytrium dendrobatidis (strain JEL423) TaxID=403673 RepID=A0A177W6T5_BATDL|nr:hypothetical protein BDEG_20007 [Batrachochytrium dendrobatidis JEL423]